MATGIPNVAEINEFYAEFWNSEAWGCPEPNCDEQLRAEAITRLIEQFVVPIGGRNLTILDLGCGRGWLTSLLSRYGSVLGIDPVPAAIERAKVLFPNLNVRLAQTEDLINEGFAGRFDLIVSSEVIEHVPNGEKKSFMTNIHRLLKPGGFAALTTPRGELLELWSENFPPEQPIEEWINEKDLDRLCESAGFSIVTRDRLFLSEFPYDWLSRIAARQNWLRHVGLQKRLRHHRAIYQVILLRRPL